jgi:hypothetical protein
MQPTNEYKKIPDIIILGNVVVTQVVPKCIELL